MNLLSKILLGAVVIAAFACLWYLLTQKNKTSASCGGNCAACASPCAAKGNSEKQE